MRQDWVAEGFRPEDESALRLIEWAAINNGIDKPRLKELYEIYRAAPPSHGPDEHARDIFEYMQRKDWPEGDRELIAGWIGNVQSFAEDFGDIPQPPSPPRVVDVRERDRILELMKTDPLAYAKDEQAQIDLHEIYHRLGSEDIEPAEPVHPADSDATRRQIIEAAMKENDPRYWRADGPLRREYEGILQRNHTDDGPDENQPATTAPAEPATENDNDS